IIDTLNLRHDARRWRVHSWLARELQPVVGDFDPVADCKSHYRIVAEAGDSELIQRGYRGDGRCHGSVLRRPFERRAAMGAAIVNLNTIQTIFQTTITTARRQ